ncbi:MAG: hypothetical protein HY331_12780 [Chloroflexi bacterium]|nr:hypothetical protein [Chloroflexota bacterium]
MTRTIRIGIIGDFNTQSRSHLATNAALHHAAQSLAAGAEIRWLPTDSLLGTEGQTALDSFDAFWAAPGGPFQSLEGALAGIRFARERNRPFVGT